jgi:hypothetical protein
MLIAFSGRAGHIVLADVIVTQGQLLALLQPSAIAFHFACKVYYYII